jgi:hypothetical protein
MMVWGDTCCMSPFNSRGSGPNACVTYSTQLDAEKRLALQEEKQVLEAKLLEV